MPRNPEPVKLGTNNTRQAVSFVKRSKVCYWPKCHHGDAELGTLIRVQFLHKSVCSEINSHKEPVSPECSHKDRPLFENNGCGPESLRVFITPTPHLFVSVFCLHLGPSCLFVWPYSSVTIARLGPLSREICRQIASS